MFIEEFLRSKNMTVQTLCEAIGCCRQVIWRLKTGKSISRRHAEMIEKFTEGKVTAEIKTRGKDHKKRLKIDNTQKM